MKKTLYSLVVLFAFAAIVSCGNANKPAEVVEAVVDTTIVEVVDSAATCADTCAQAQAEVAAPATK